ncbi:MAG: octaprenyl-diphosphate synthase [Flavobacteriales bacterium]|jgi:octaprenyl-diphosphate synthase|tara:strand:+ start:1873 stop:2850 length:978 start_codon:yes stop_codon:yes gene_type:complete
MASVKSIKAPIATEMNLFEDKFKEVMKGSAPLLDKITHYIVKRKGKQMRPMFVFLAANLCGGVTERTYRAASLIEMIHTATLVHDDVVDDANKRRGFFSINALWKNKIAVLVGDFLLSKGLQLASQNKDYDFLEIISEASKEMSEGELLQIEKARRLDIKEEVYFEIIRQKTATLIAACCASGASSAGGSAEEVKKLKLLGEKIGVAFQIKDDLFDYESSVSLIGKPVGIDIKERKMTLPLIYALNNSTKKEKRWMISVVKNHNENQKKVTELIEKVKASGGIEYTKKKMYEIREEAIQMINQYPESPSRQSLIDLILYTTEREK